MPTVRMHGIEAEMSVSELAILFKELDNHSPAAPPDPLASAHLLLKTLSGVRRVIIECVGRAADQGVTTTEISDATGKMTSEVSRALNIVCRTARAAGLKDGQILRTRMEGKIKRWFPGRLLVAALSQPADAA